jgi:hypothetical protein
MPPTETAERGSTRDFPETHPPEPGVGPTPEAAVPQTPSAKQGLPVWVMVAVVAALAAMTVAWVGALATLAWLLIRAIL